MNHNIHNQPLSDAGRMASRYAFVASRAALRVARIGWLRDARGRDRDNSGAGSVGKRTR
ncbi:MAG: hypothetical protein ACO1Q7_11065 [Gemmatimonas sp.]